MICPYCRAPQDPATGHCSTVGKCGNAAQPPDRDPLDDPASDDESEDNDDALP